MGISWNTFEMPRRIEVDESTRSDTYATFIAEPFERGYGTTIGNCLRRVLLSSLEGAAVTSIKIDSALHEFTTVEGVEEDITEVVLNLKQVVVRSHADGPKTVTLKADKPGPVLAGQIECDDTVEVVNPDALVATLAAGSKLQMELEVGRGRGFVTAERNKREDLPIGVIPIDSLFGPVRKVNFKVENARVGQMTDYDRLILEIWTNASVTPQDALVQAAQIMQGHLDLFVAFGQPDEEEMVTESEEERDLRAKLKQLVSDLELSVRSANCLREAKIISIADLVQKSEAEMLTFRNFGKKSLSEIQEVLGGMGLQFGMTVEHQEEPTVQASEDAVPDEA